MLRRQHTPRAERIEWILGGISGAAVLAVAGYLLWQGLADRSAADLHIGAAPGGTERQLRFRVRNDGVRTATDVAVSLTLRQGNELLAERHLVIDYVPGRSEVEGTFLLPATDVPLSPELEIEGYLDP